VNQHQKLRLLSNRQYISHTRPPSSLAPHRLNVTMLHCTPCPSSLGGPTLFFIPPSRLPASAAQTPVHRRGRSFTSMNIIVITTTIIIIIVNK